MRPGGVVSFKRINLLKYLGVNRLLLLMFISFFVGFIVGNTSFGNLKVAGFSEMLFKHYIDIRQNSFIHILFSVVFQYFAFTVLLFAAGTSLTGVIVSPILCCSIGIYFGALLSYTYSAYTLKGIAFNSVIMIPPALVFTLCALFAAKEAFRFSSVMLRITFPKSRPVNLSVEFKCYCGKFLFYTVLAFAAAVIDAVVSSAFLKHFSFI